MAWLNELKRRNPLVGRTDTYYQIQWRPNPTNRRKVASRALGFVSQADAQRALTRFEALLAAELRQQKPEGSCSAVEQTLGSWLQERVLPSYHARYGQGGTFTLARHLTKSLCRHLGDLPLGTISAADADRYILARRENRRRSETIRKELRLLNQALKLAVEDGILEKMPTLRLPRNNDKRPLKFLTGEQSVALLKALQDSDPLSLLAIFLCVSLGFRRGEVLHLRWEDVDWGASSMLVRRKEEGNLRWSTKTGEGRSVPISTVQEDLRAWWIKTGSPAEGWVFPSKKSVEIPRKSFRGALRGACKRAGIPTVHPHALRHSFASRLLAAGIDMRTVMDVGGWKRVDTLQEVYAHTTRKQAARALEVAAVDDGRGLQGVRAEFGTR